MYKPVGWTSFDLVKKVRSITREKKVGHGGTLDPFAEGVLIIGTGKETKLLTQVSDEKKSYNGVIQLGSETNTLDTEGEVINTTPIPAIDRNDLNKTLHSFKGKYIHKPPMFSAKKVNGTRLYKLARKNIEIDRKKLISTIYDIKLNDYSDQLIDFSVTCSKGTYIRVLASDIAKKIGTIGYLVKLIRTSIGDYKISNSLSIDKFESQWKSIES
jgi:tRNA pseudouridine55 synthase